MPHYVTQLDDKDADADCYAVYSTIVDNLISEEMCAEDMRTYLEYKEYGSWLLPPGDNSDLDERWPDDPDFRQEIIDWRKSTEQYSYWNEEYGFQYVKLSDNYFTLARKDWRWE